VCVAQTQEQAEEAARFLSYEQIGQIIASPDAAAETMAEIILGTCVSSFAGFEIEDALKPVSATDESLLENRLRRETILAYLTQPQMGPFIFIGHDVPHVSPGGILAIYREREDFIFVPRIMIENHEAIHVGA
jgi:hypothetical protein